ncbi:MAG: pseudouridine synthase [Synechococcales cyanobacterium]
MATERIQKLLAQWGVASRRHAEQMIVSGRVSLNGIPVLTLGTKANPAVDRLAVDGRPIAPPPLEPLTILVHKPVGVLSTCRDPQRRRTVLDLLPKDVRLTHRLYPVGRLDAESSGALLLSSDGDLALRLTHPRYHVPKTYRVWVTGIPSPATIQRWREGIELEDGRTQPAHVRLLHQQGQTQTELPQAELEFILSEGRNRQIRRMAAAAGHTVVQLHRVAIGSLRLGVLGLGKFRRLSPTEVWHLKCESDHGCS